MYWYRVSSALAAIVAFGTFLIAASSQAGQYEGAPTFSAAQAIQGVPLHGADYSISDRVPVENFQYAFSVNTKWGPLRVKGSDLLRVRLREITATEKLEESNEADGLRAGHATFFAEASSPDIRLFGENSTSYLEQEGAAQAAAEVLGTAQIVVMLRDPLERAVSNWRFSSEHGLEDRPLEQALRDAQQEIYIISPWMNRRACNDALCDLIAAALRRGVRVVIGFGMAEGGRDVEEAQRNEYNTRGVLYALRQRCPADALARLEVYRTQGTHQKLLVQDEALGITSTFNWLSYVGLRDAGYRSEMGVAVRDGEDVRRLRVEAQETLRGAERVRP
jgi:phosphatidylserine/phosphatidylglycerophosphate/cardiolipin synthase-like enzyme